MASPLARPRRRLAAAPAALLACLLVAGTITGPPARGQAPPPPPSLRLNGLVPAGARTSATESWGSYALDLTNLSDTDRVARVLLFFPQRPDVQYGRDVWVPAHASLTTWMLAGPVPPQEHPGRCDMQILLYDRTDGTDHLVLPPTGERVRDRGVPYRKREPTTAVLIDDEQPAEPEPGALPQPDSAAVEALRLARTFRLAARLSEHVQVVSPGPLPPTVEGLAGIDHFVIASERLADDPAGMATLRRWLEQGGTVWVMLDRVRANRLAPLLGDALDFEVVDRVGLTNFRMDAPAVGQRGSEGTAQEHERPVDLVRVQLPAHERIWHAVNGWPVWFSRRVGRGKVVFTALGPRGWYRPRDHGDPPAPFEHYADTPVPSDALDVVANVLQSPEEEAFRAESFRAPLAGEIGYAVVSRGLVALVFGAFLVCTLALGLALRRSRRPEWIGLLAPAAALAAAGGFVAVGDLSRRAAPPTVAMAQVVEAAPGTSEAPVHGLLAAYRPDSGPDEPGAAAGGFFEPDLAGAEGQAHRFLVTDRGAWHWENLALPAGVRWAPFRAALATREPVEAVARLGPDGLEGKLAAGPFRDLGDALVATAADHNLAVRMGPDGAFRAGTEDVLPPGQFLAGAVLSDRQQRRQRLYREFLQPRHGKGPGDAGPLLLAWAEPADTDFTLTPGARTVGAALLAVPLRLEPLAPGTRVTIPAPLIPYRRLLDGVPVRALRDARGGADMELRFELPTAVLPFRVERARLTAKISAPTRRITITAPADGKPVELYRGESPVGPIRLDITDGRLLRLDADGGLHVNLEISDVLQHGVQIKGQAGAEGDDRWVIDYLEIEATGRAEGD